jgi:HSP20 family molecular chaperone IbpA
MSQTWNQFVIDILKDGATTFITMEVAGMYEKLLGIQLVDKNLTANDAFAYIFKELKRIYKKGECVKRML